MDARTQQIEQQEITRDDPQWYKDAVIYQLHVKAFFDSNNDGVGDFAGLAAKLDYLQDLGVTAIWLLPFYPSPLKDDGYDIADYRQINPSYGQLRDFRQLVRECHRRGLRVITELVVNHTSDQHPWFQRARKARPGSAYRNFYVWSDTKQRYEGTRIIFLDTERSNWSWDTEAQAYYWHRFYSHQPDLNYDNPRVLKEITRVLRYWLDMGVDGMRLDAVPYLVEREGTNNENLQETHDVLKQIRAEVDARFPDRMLLAEANQWPEDVLPYFGEGDECHMAFHFPLMPRIYMAIAQEDRHPVTDIMRQTPDIPDNCQWAIFLRNHDELTLEMVTERERDYLWQVYAHDRRMRINLGIRRRLAPLMDNDRRKIELMNGLLFSLPGTPIVYYGDEIGMGDNVFLGDRDGVRTPMQWSPDRNGGFSKADPPRLYLPPIMDPIYGYEALNIEAQARSPASLLNWTKRMIAVRQRHRSFGRGTIRFLFPGNRKILAYLREHDDEAILCVFNLSRAAQAVELDLARFKGRVPIELSGRSVFPPIGELYYLLTLPAYGFHWFVLEKEEAVPEWHQQLPPIAPEFVTLVARNGIRDIARQPARRQLENDILPEFLARQRWFSAKGERISSTAVVACTGLGDNALLSEVVVSLAGGGKQRYFLPLALASEESDGATHAQLPYTLARLRRGQRLWALLDAAAADGFVRALAAAIRDRREMAMDPGRLVCESTERLMAIELAPDAEVRRLSVDQSNSSIMIGGTTILKLYRKLTPGVHPEVEVGRFLTRVGFDNTPPLLGAVEHIDADGTSTVLAILQGFVENQGDGFRETVEHLERRLEERALVVPGDDDNEAPPLHDFFIDLIATLGRRTAELHHALATETGDPAFDPEPVRAADTRAWRTTARKQARQAFTMLRRIRTSLPAAGRTTIDELAARKAECMETIDALSEGSYGAAKTRIHGDYHLGQVLIAQNDWVILDFEGEPAKTLAERRGKYSPLRDVAGMLRSFDYAAWTALGQLDRDTTPPGEAVVGFARDWRDAAAQAFLTAYHEAILGAPSWPDDAAAARRWLDLFTLEKACYEIVYEANNRPDWLPIPVRGVMAILDAHADG
ncbi:MAG TPA: maltose alpha-D-glucosyltransferase [Gammaproteobacteria bacterium]|nr:maltose alpha-D-glucosyltransferase [Gammaproteobacteria bacterium]